MKRFQDPGRALRRLEWIEAIIMGYDPGAAQVESRPAHQLRGSPKMCWSAQTTGLRFGKSSKKPIPSSKNHNAHVTSPVRREGDSPQAR